MFPVISANVSRQAVSIAAVSLTALTGSHFLQRAFYHKNIIDHFEKPHNVGSFDKKSLYVGTGLVGAPACGDVMKLQIEVDENNRIIDACFKTFGCGSAIASSSLMTEMVKGRTLDDALTIKNTDIARELRLPPVKVHCSLLAEDSVRAAIKNLKEKRAKVHVAQTTSSK